MSLIESCLIPDWPAPANVRSLQTTRVGGVSLAPYGTLNLGSHVGDIPLSVAHNRMLFNPLLPSEPVWLEQMHGTQVVHAEEAGCHPQADACITQRCSAVCAVMTADCLPVLLCDQRGTVVAAVHAGWKGLLAGVIEATVQKMPVATDELMAWLGPAISQPAFEVGAEVRSAFTALQPHADSAFIAGQNGRWQADLYALARMRLNALGIQQVFGGDCCTFNESGRFFSYRRDGITGRMATLIWLE